MGEKGWVTGEVALIGWRRSRYRRRKKKELLIAFGRSVPHAPVYSRRRVYD